MLSENQNKAKDLLKKSIINKKANSLNDTNIFVDYLKFQDCPYSVHNYYEHTTKFDTNQIISFFIDYKMPIFNLETITKEIDKIIPKLISEKILSEKSKYYINDLRLQLSFSELYTPTEEEVKLSEMYGWKKDIFGNKKDNRTDLLIYICSKRNNLKIIITSNAEDFE